MKYLRVVLLLALSVKITSLHSEEVRVLLNPKPKDAVGALVIIFPETQYVEKGQLTFEYRLLNRSKYDIFAVVDGEDIVGHKLHGTDPYWGSGGSIIPGPTCKETFRLLYAPELDSQGKPTSGWDQTRAEAKCNVTVRPSRRNRDLTGYAGGSGELNLRIVFYVDHAENRVVKTLSAPIKIEAKEKEQFTYNTIWAFDPWGPQPLDLPAKEAERSAKVQELVQRLADSSPERRKDAFVKLRDTFIRKRDIPLLTQITNQNIDPEVAMSLEDIIRFIEPRWRLPDKGWVGEYDYWESYEKEFEKIGCFVIAGGQRGYRRDWATEGLNFVEIPSEEKNWTRAIDLILTLEPKALKLCESWPDINFIGALPGLEELTLKGALVDNLTPLKEITSLRGVWIQGTKVTDLAPLRGLRNLEYINLCDTGVTDLGPLKWKPKIKYLHLANTNVSDLTPLKGLSNLRVIDITNTKVTDLTPLADIDNLRIEGDSNE